MKSHFSGASAVQARQNCSSKEHAWLICEVCGRQDYNVEMREILDLSNGLNAGTIPCCHVCIGPKALKHCREKVQSKFIAAFHEQRVLSGKEPDKAMENMGFFGYRLPKQDIDKSKKTISSEEYVDLKCIAKEYVSEDLTKEYIPENLKENYEEAFKKVDSGYSEEYERRLILDNNSLDQEVVFEKKNGVDSRTVKELVECYERNVKNAEFEKGK
jgi:hypothetical protein